MTKVMRGSNGFKRTGPGLKAGIFGLALIHGLKAVAFSVAARRTALCDSDGDDRSSIRR